MLRIGEEALISKQFQTFIQSEVLEDPNLLDLPVSAIINRNL